MKVRDDNPFDYCELCGAYLAGSWTQHEPFCAFYEHTRNVYVPPSARERLRSLKRSKPNEETRRS